MKNAEDKDAQPISSFTTLSASIYANWLNEAKDAYSFRALSKALPSFTIKAHLLQQSNII